VFRAASGTAATTGLLGTTAADEGTAAVAAGWVAGGLLEGGGVDDAVLPALGVVTLTLGEYAFGLFGY
jgi:hypothetical protein